MKKYLLKVILVAMLLAVAAFAWGQTAFYQEPFDTNNGWTLESNWSFASGALKLDWSPSATNYDLSATSPNIVVPASAGDMVVSQHVDQYTYEEGDPPETFEIIVVANGTPNVLWSYDTNADWGVTGGEDLTIPLAPYAGQTIQLKFRSTGASTFNFNGWYIYDIKAYASLNQDLAATSITGTTTPSMGSVYPYVITVRNGGLSTVSNYTVKLMQTGNVTLGSIAGTTITSGESIEFPISWTPTVTGTTELWGEIVLVGDENPNNDQTAPLTVTVMEAGLLINEIGNGTVIQRFPLGSYYGYERSAALYTAAELGAQNTRVSAISWYSSIATTAAVPTKIYLKTIGSSTLTTDTWANMISGATLLYDHTQTGLAAGDWNLFALDFSFDVDQGDNLMILVERNFGGNGASTAGGSSNGGGIYSTAVPGAHLTWNGDNEPHTGDGSTESIRPNVRIAYTTYTIDTPPNPAIVNSPANAATDVLLNASLNWNSGGGGPTGYRLSFGTNNPPTNIVNNVDQGDVFTYSPVSLAYGTTYYWKVVPYNTNGSATGSVVWSFTTMDNPTIASFPHIQNFDAVTVPALPFGWSSINVNNDTVNWASYGTNPNTAPNCASIGYNSSLALDDWMVTPPINLQAGTTYALDFAYRGGSTSYVEKLEVMLGTGDQVADLSTQIFVDEAINFTTYTEASATFTVPSTGTYYLGWHAYSIANQLRMYVDDVKIRIPAPVPPQPATAAFPLNGSSTLLNPKLQWAPSALGEPASSYKVYLNQSGIFSEGDLVYEGTDRHYPSTGMSFSQTYYWKVIPTNAFGPAPACPIWTFNTPGADQLAEGFEATAFPPVGWANGTSGSWTRSTSTPLFEGTAHAYKYTSTSTVYVLSTPMVDVNSRSAMDFYTRASATSQTLQMVYSTDRTNWIQIGADITYAAINIWYPISIDLSILPEGSYYIGFQTPTQTSTGSIYIDHVVGPELTPVLPGIPTLTAPTNAAVNQSRYPKLTWNADATGGVPAEYNIYLDTNPEPTTLFDTSIATTYNVINPLDWDTTYYWKVAATNNAGIGEASTVRSFTVMSDPTIYDLPWMEDFGTVSGDWPVLNWTQLSGLYPEPTGTTAQWSRGDWIYGPAGNNAPRINIYGTSRYGWLVTPPIAIPTDGHELKFDVGLTKWASSVPILDDTDQQDDRFIVIVSDSPAMTNPTILREWNNAGSEYVFNSILHTGESTTIDLTGYSGEKYFAFYGESTVSGGDNALFVDNVMVREIPVGPPDPVTLISPADEATDLSLDGFNLTWAPALTGGNPDSYAIFMSQTEADLYSDQYWDNITLTRFDPTQAETNPLTYNYGETWYWTVQVLNGDGDAFQETPFSFTIVEDPTITSFPYTENFDGTWVGTPAAPLGWTVINADNDSYTWRQGNTYVGAHSAPNAAMGYGNTNDYMITPPIALTDTNLRLSWWDKVEGASHPNSYKVLLSTTDTQVSSFTVELANIVCTNTAWTEHNIDITGYSGQTVYLAFYQYASDATYWGFSIDDFMLNPLVANDLAASAFSGDSFGTAGDELSYNISVYNNGTAEASSYSVELLSMPANTILASIDISTPLASAATAEHTLTWTPAAAGVYNVYAKVVLSGDMVPANDVSEAMTVGVYSATSYIPFIGDPESTSTTYYTPFNMYFNNNVSETIYMAHEMQMASGTINAIMYHNNFTQNLTLPVKIWMAHTTLSVTDAWLPFEDYTLVFDGNVHFPIGVNAIVIPLQTSFQYTGGNLAVRTNRVHMGSCYSSSDKFYYTLDSDYPNRTRYCLADSDVFDPADPVSMGTGSRNSYVPNTAFIVDPYTAMPPLSAPALQIELSGSNPSLSWEAVEGAFNYVIYGSDDPYNWAEATEIATTTNLTYNISSAPAMKFYKVAARSYNHGTREIGQVFNPAAVIGFDNSAVKAMPVVPGRGNKD